MISFKRVLSLAISLALVVADKLRSILTCNGRTRCVVLMYHGIPAQFRAHFAQQMDLLLRIAVPIRAGDPKLPDERGNYVAVTFDDGLQSTIDNALPVLKDRQIPATLFIVTEALGREPEWEHYKP